MLLIFIGVVFALIDVNVFFGIHIFDVLPDFIGYVLIALGAFRVHRLGKKFKSLLLPSAVMVFISIAEYILNAIGILRALWGFPTVLFAIVGNVIPAVIIFFIIEGLRNIESERGIDLKTGRLYRIFPLWAIFTAIYVVFGLSASETVQTASGEISSAAYWLMLAGAAALVACMFVSVKRFYATEQTGSVTDPAESGQSPKKRPWEE